MRPAISDGTRNQRLLAAAMKPNQRWWLVDSVILLLLAIISGVWFLWHHAYGAYGDDAPGYIYSAHQLLAGEATVQQDVLVQDALAWFGDEQYARFVAPAHHEIIAPTGWITSRYPLGLSVLMALAAWISGTITGIYLVVPVFAVVVVLCTYLGAVWLLPVPTVWKRLLGIGAAVIVLSCDLFAHYAVAQPMREIPSLGLFLIAMLVFCTTLRATGWKQALGIVVAGLAFGYSVGIRETSAILVLPLIWFGISRVKQQRWRVAGWFLLGAVIAYSWFIVQAVNITAHKEAFRDKDITSVAITSNIDHIQSLSITNLWDNQGKFKPGVGGLQQYWEVINKFSAWPLFLFCAVLGLVYIWRKDRALGRLLVSWTGCIVLLFGMWVNPYPRYVLPILPVLAWTSMVGTFALWQWCADLFQLRRGTDLALLGLMALGFVLANQPAIAERQEHVRTGATVDRELTKADLDVVLQVGAAVTTDAQSTGKTPLLLMLGTTKGGLAETIMAHTQLRVIRFPSKDKEQPPLDQLATYIQHLDETYTLYLWYDPSVTANEQRFYNQQVLVPIIQTTTSYQPAISIYRLEY